MKHSFRNDYSELAHPDVLSLLSSVGSKQFEGYGNDEYSIRARELIKGKIEKPSADVHFISGGTQANAVVISSILRPHEAVIACESGHICTYETGAIEATGHKICAVKSESGKLCADDIIGIVSSHNGEHMVKPRLVFISQSAETGAVYKKAELSALSDCCKANGLVLYIDGARLGAGINSRFCDLSYAGFANTADVFYIGGTKNGAMFGEAVVICNDTLKEDFRYHMKQKGALLAKGASIGLQFEALFESGLYDRLAVHANETALKLAEGIGELGYKFLYKPETNQIFPIFPNKIADKLHTLYDFLNWRQMGEETAVRLVTSWNAEEGMVNEFLGDLKGLYLPRPVGIDY